MLSKHSCSRYATGIAHSSALDNIRYPVDIVWYFGVNAEFVALAATVAEAGDPEYRPWLIQLSRVAIKDMDTVIIIVIDNHINNERHAHEQYSPAQKRSARIAGARVFPPSPMAGTEHVLRYGIVSIHRPAVFIRNDRYLG